MISTTPLHFVLFIFLGFGVGAFGTLIGVGGGFLIIPLLLWLYPDQPPEVITSISLAVVFCNAFSGTVAYARMRRVDYRSGLLFSATALPGTVLGALSTQLFERGLFDIVISALLIAVSIALLWQSGQHKDHTAVTSDGRMKIAFTDVQGTLYRYSYNPFIGLPLSLCVGYLSGLLGIGGGIIHVPAMVHLLNFPVHVATATSHFILALMSSTATITHLLHGELLQGIALVIPLAIGVVVGAQAGARISHKVHGVWILRSLAIALFFVALRTLWGALR